MGILKGEKVAVCGSVGSEKSSLLSTTLGDIPRILVRSNSLWKKGLRAPGCLDSNRHD